ncbi:MAG: flagellar biosynthetic protein FliR [Candidatus Eisenbacteria bacterium]
MDPLIQSVLQPDRWPLFVLLTARIGGLMLTAPLWSMSGWPRAGRAAFTVVLAMMLLPLAPAGRVPEEVLELPVPVAMELLIGSLIGLAAAVIVQGVALAGEIISIQMGLSFGALLAPMPELAMGGVGPLQSMLALLLYTTIGGHLVLVRGLAESLVTLPPGAPIDLAAGLAPILALLATLFITGLRAAAPIVIALFLTQIALAVLSRAVPQINAMVLSFPITIGVGFLMLYLALPFLSMAIAGWLGDLPASITRTLEPLRPAAMGR